MVTGVLERWRGDDWAQEVECWIRDAARSAGSTVTGPPRIEHVRFWSVVLEVPTDRGVLWFKECGPGQKFEPAGSSSD